MRRYLAEFLSDTRIVDLPRALWLPILHGVILNVRPAATARNYAKIWDREHDESPLRVYTRAQAEGVAQAFGDHVRVDWAMRYGTPSIASRLDALQRGGMHAHSGPAALSAVLRDHHGERHGRRFRRPQGHALAAGAAGRAGPFMTNQAILRRSRPSRGGRLETLDWSPERVVISFHGLPQRYFDAGDPYHCHCAKTARLLREAMGWTDDFAPLAFQSKFGREKWLEPATEGHDRGTRPKPA